MATRATKTERRWRRIVEKWRKSGLSASVFGSRRGITAEMIYAWSSRLRKQDSVAAEAVQPDTALQFLPVQVLNEATIGHDPQDRHDDVLEIVLPRGEVIRVPPGADLSHLARVVAALHGEQAT